MTATAEAGNGSAGVEQLVGQGFGYKMRGSETDSMVATVNDSVHTESAT